MPLKVHGQILPQLKALNNDKLESWRLRCGNITRFCHLLFKNLILVLKVGLAWFAFSTTVKDPNMVFFLSKNTKKLQINNYIVSNFYNFVSFRKPLIWFEKIWKSRNVPQLQIWRKTFFLKLKIGKDYYALEKAKFLSKDYTRSLKTLERSKKKDYR